MAMITCDMIISREPVNYLQYQFQFSARIGKTKYDQVTLELF